MVKFPRALALAAITLLLLSGCVFLPGQETDDEPVTSIGGVEVLVSEPVSADAYLNEFQNRDGSMNADGVRHEYERAATIFPFELPEGYAFPVEPILIGENDGYQVGYGVSEAFQFWTGATATAAYAAHERGNDAEAGRLLEILEEGYVSPVRSLYMDPEHPGEQGPALTNDIRPAQNGDFTSLHRMHIAGFLNRDENRAIAVAAGDVTE